MKRRSFVKALAACRLIAGIRACHSGGRAAQEQSRSACCIRCRARWRSARPCSKDVALMAIDEINAKGGVMGTKLEPVVVDPASNWPLFAEKARQLITQDKVAVGVRLLDLGVAQVGAAGVRGAERPALLPGAVRGRGALEERVLHRRRAQPAGDPGGRVPDEQGRRRRQALGAARHRLRLPAHDQQDPARVPQVEGRRRRATSTRSTRRSATATTRPSSPTSRSSPPAARPRWSRPSTATRTCRSTRNWATRA